MSTVDRTAPRVATSEAGVVRQHARDLLIVPSYVRGYGGVEQWVETLATVGARAGWCVTVVPPRRLDPGGPLETALTGRATVRSAESCWQRTSVGRAWRAAALARSVLRERRVPDHSRRATLGGERAKPFVDGFWVGDGAALIRGAGVVHVVGSHPFGARAIAAAGRQGVRVLYNETARVTERSAADPYHDPFRAALGSIDTVVTHASELADGFARAYDHHGRVEVIDQWVDEPLERELLALAPSGRGSPGEHPIRVGSLSRLSPEKGLGTLIEAVARTVAQGLDVRLVLAGEGPSAPSLRAAAEDLGVADRVEFLGFVAPGDRAAFYDSIDVFVIGSTGEGGPLTGVEAMAAGRAVVTTPVGAMPDRVVDGRSGLVFAIGDACRLADHLASLVRDPASVGRLGAAARASYRERNTSARQVATLLGLWSDLSARRSPAR